MQHSANGQSRKALKAIQGRKSGPFAVRLPGSLEVSTEDFNQISGVYTDDASDGSYIVEFLQKRDADRYKKQAATCWQASVRRVDVRLSIAAPGSEARLSPSPPGLLGPQPTSLPMPFQKKTKNNGFSESAPPMPPPAVQMRHEVEVTGLPRNLMSKPMMETILEQAGLEKEMLGFTALSPNLARITLTTEHSAQMCAAHFHNRKWNHHSDERVVATVVPNFGSTPKANFRAQPGISEQTRNVAIWPNKAHAPMHNQHRVGVSDASTNVSDEEHEEEWWVADLVGQTFSV